VPPFRLILASQSPRRKALLKSLGIRMLVKTPKIIESLKPAESPVGFSKRMAREKAQAAAARYPEDWILGADTIVVLDRKILGKPKNLKEAAAFLTALSGRTHRVITSFCLLNRHQNLQLDKSVVTSVSFKPLTPHEIEWYVAGREPLDKAGAYGIQEKGAFLIKRINGSYTNVVGLPLAEVVEALEACTRFRLGR